MKRIISILPVLLSLILILNAQNSKIYKGWDVSVIAAANTAVDSEFLNEDEKKVILISNLARADGPLFAETILKKYLILKGNKGDKYIKSLYKDLKKVHNLPMLVPRKDLYNVARDHATRSGKKGYKGHKGFKTRYTPVLERYMEVGENIYYGLYTPEEIVLQLLIDEGVKDLGHRANLLNPKYNSIGVSIKPHKSYEYNCVQSFGYKPESYQDYIR